MRRRGLTLQLEDFVQGTCLEVGLEDLIWICPHLAGQLHIQGLAPRPVWDLLPWLLILILVILIFIILLWPAAQRSSS